MAWVEELRQRRLDWERRKDNNDLIIMSEIKNQESCYEGYVEVSSFTQRKCVALRLICTLDITKYTTYLALERNQYFTKNKTRIKLKYGSVKSLIRGLLNLSKVWPEMSEIMTFLDIASAEKIAKIPFLAAAM